MTGSLRSKLLWLHTWVGMATAVVMLLFSMTGTVLVLREYIDPLADARFHQIQSCTMQIPLDRIEQIAATANPGSRTKSLDFVPGGNDSVAIEFHNDDFVYVDPCTGDVLGIQNEYAGFTGTLDWLHRFRFVENGRLIAGWFNAGILIFIVIGGVVLWWPSSRALLRARLQFDFHLPGVARTLSLHRFLGIYSSIWLLMLTLTALPLSFVWARDALGWAMQSSTATPSAPANVSTTGLPVSLETARLQAIGQLPDASWISIDVPKEAYVPIRIEFLEKDALHKEAKSYLYLDSVTGAVIERLDNSRNISAGRKAYQLTIALHLGLVGGLAMQLILAVACLLVPVQIYSGLSPYIRKFARRSATRGLRLQLVKRHVEADCIVSFEFADPRGRPLPAFSAGSHCDLHLGPDMVRQYSLCNNPAERHRYVIAVQRANDSRGGSIMLHDKLNIGQVIKASVPRNHFPLARTEGHSVLIAGGIGITPILCMAEWLAATRGSFELHYCVRSRANAAFVSHIFDGALAPYSTMHISEENGRLNVNTLLQSIPQDSHIYVCGPIRLNEGVESSAAAAGWDPAMIHREYFTAATIDSSHDTPFEVRVSSTGATLPVPADKSIVEVLAAAGIEIPTSCSQGTCGTCVTRVLEGEIVHRDLILTPEQRDRNDRMTPCCSRASSKLLVLDL